MVTLIDIPHKTPDSLNDPPRCFSAAPNKPTGRCVRGLPVHRPAPAESRLGLPAPESKPIPVQFNPVTRFDLNLGNPPTSSVEATRRLAQIKETLMREFQATTPEPFEREQIRFAVSEAEALAWASPFPLLVLPELARETVDRAKSYAKKQQDIWQRTQALLPYEGIPELANDSFA